MVKDNAASLPSFDELVSEFEFLGSWEDQCDYLIDLGFELPSLPETAKTEQNRVHGCQSNVWLVHEFAGAPGRLNFSANSDGMFVNGLIVALLAIFNGLTPREILDTDAEAKLDQLGISKHVSPQRRNGLFGMVERLRQAAAAEVVESSQA